MMIIFITYLLYNGHLNRIILYIFEDQKDQLKLADEQEWFDFVFTAIWLVYMRESLYFINSHLYVYFNSDDSPPEKTAPPQKVAPQKTGTLGTHLWVQLWIIFCIYNLGNMGWLRVQIINLHRPSLTVNIENVWRKLPNFGKNGQRHTMRGQLGGQYRQPR